MRPLDLPKESPIPDPAVETASSTVPPGRARRDAGLILEFGFLSAMAPLSVDIYLPALPMLQKSFAADEARTLFTLSAFLVGFGVGQLFIGPLSDRFGRKRPLLAGLTLYLGASVACALAPSIDAVILGRFVQALGGCAVPVMVQAMVRDLYSRDEGARVLSLNMLVMGLAPIAAPLVGGQVLLWLDWRAIFWVLALFGVLALVAAAALPETLSDERRNQAHPWAMIASYGELFLHRRYLGYVFGGTFYYGALFAFIAGSPFVYIEHFGVPPEYYGFLFGVNMIGMMLASFVNSRIVVRRGLDRMLRVAYLIGAGGAVLLLATGGLAGIGGIAGIALPCFIVLSMLAVIGANSIAGALALFPEKAGSAAALSGALQFGMGAVSGAAVGWFADGTPGPMSFIIFASVAVALLINWFLVGRSRPA
jgi:MFS transporter, DHA1 family, multidrug resistance protein